MATDYDIGRAAARQGWKAPPDAGHYIPNKQRQAGFNHALNAPRPAPQPSQPNTTQKTR